MPYWIEQIRKIRSHPQFDQFVWECRVFGIAHPFKLSIWPEIWKAFLERNSPAFGFRDKRQYYRNVYLRSPHWASLKAGMLKKFTCCQLCESTKTLDVHHRCYKNLYDVSETDLIVLCRSCHDAIHKLGEVPATSQERERLVELKLSKELYRRSLPGLIRRLFIIARQSQKRYGGNWYEKLHLILTKKDLSKSPKGV